MSSPRFYVELTPFGFAVVRQRAMGAHLVYIEGPATYRGQLSQRFRAEEIAKAMNAGRPMPAGYSEWEVAV